MADPPTTRREDGPSYTPETRGEVGMTRAEGSATRAEGGATRAESGQTRAEDGRTRAESGGRDGPGVGARASRIRRVRLPEPLEERYDHLYDLEEAGAQADIAVCQDRESGDEVAVKLYRIRAEQVDIDAIEKLRSTDPRHVVPIMEFQTWGGLTWEIQEFFPLGSLAALLAREVTVSGDLARQLFDELAGALTHIHERDIVHRDLKPQNILLRDLEPLDCVIADFGMATNLDLSIDIRSIAGTFPYLPKEAHGGILTKAGDWWALGMIMYEALHGRHLFADPTDGRMLPDNHVRAMVTEGTYSLMPLEDERWDLLLRGLLVHDHTHRWGAVEVEAWRAGDSPNVHTAPVAPPRHTVRPFPFAGRTYSEPSELGAAIRDNWKAACDLLAGRGAEDLKIWLRQTDVGGEAEHVLSGGVQPDSAAIRLQVILNPGSPPRFRGRDLNTTSLNEVLSAAQGGDLEACEWITQLRRLRILSAWSSEADTDDAVRVADGLLDSWWSEVDSLVEQVPVSQREEIAPARTALEPTLLIAALDEQSRDKIAEQATRSVEDSTPLPEWAAPIARRAGEQNPSLGAAAVATLILPVAARLEQARLDAERRARRHAEQEQARQRRAEATRTARQRARRSFTRWWAPYGVVGALGTIASSVEPGAVVGGAVLGLACASAVAAWHLFLPEPASRVGHAVPVLTFLWGAVIAVAELGPQWPFNNAGAVALPIVVAIAVWAGGAINLAVDRAFDGRARLSGPDPGVVTVGKAMALLSVLAILPLIYDEIRWTVDGDHISAGYREIEDTAPWYLTGLGRVTDVVEPAFGWATPFAGFLALSSFVCAFFLAIGERDSPAEAGKLVSATWLVVGVLSLVAVLANVSEVGVALFFVGMTMLALVLVVLIFVFGVWIAGS